MAESRDGHEADCSVLSTEYSVPRRWDHVLTASLIFAAILFGVFVELRGAFLSRRMTDMGVYLRAAWAIRSGAELYGVSEDNGWHYHYHQLIAILLKPLDA